ncbi:hypothetical protein LSH36_687g02021 [Paralvinella palmiformis]|uniref:Aldehyde dehydrogenase domain-containing protein n=1 Tax=Paralvinella palmiformis TaxID=53620 RepID=A0AAD9J3I3_9ANNE|nr:hypothetical protein LSH36_687g02021 [Paralvinella palmiformis]
MHELDGSGDRVMIGEVRNEQTVCLRLYREKPLVLYMFVKDDEVRKKFLEKTSSGSVCVNDSLMYDTARGLPFGGIGYSGHGNYHGKYSFDTFSHKRGCLIKKQAMEIINSWRYPPHTDRKLQNMQFMQKKKLKKRTFFGLFPFIIALHRASRRHCSTPDETLGGACAPPGLDLKARPWRELKCGIKQTVGGGRTDMCWVGSGRLRPPRNARISGVFSSPLFAASPSRRGNDVRKQLGEEPCQRTDHGR